MKAFIKEMLVHISNYLIAMENAGNHHDIYKIIHYPNDGMHHSFEVTLYANPEIDEINREESDIPDGEESKGMEQLESVRDSANHSGEQT